MTLSGMIAARNTVYSKSGLWTKSQADLVSCLIPNMEEYKQAKQGNGYHTGLMGHDAMPCRSARRISFHRISCCQLTCQSTSWHGAGGCLSELCHRLYKPGLCYAGDAAADIPTSSKLGTLRMRTGASVNPSKAQAFGVLFALIRQACEACWGSCSCCLSWVMGTAELST